ncbi:MAG: ABC transporter substrate-binding protein [Oscillospiraceae bacterium]|nr:ABC transporter substrate-binding protein [Oscillospiraceae bacterium]
MKKGRNLIVGLLLAAAILLAACAAPTGGSGGGEATPTDSIIRVGISGTPDLDPAVAMTNSSVVAAANLYDPLVWPTAEGVKPWVAERWIVSDDGLTYVFDIRQGISFHDGTELRASDVAFSMNRKMAMGEGWAYLWEGFVDYAEATGDFEVTFHMLKPFGSFVNSLVRLFIVNEALIMDNLANGPYGEFGDYGRAFLTNNTAGSGAYTFRELVHQDFFEAVRFDDWFMGWDSRPNAPMGFRQLAVPEPATVLMMMNTGLMDKTDQWQSPENLAAMAEMDGISISAISTYTMQNMYLNTQVAPMDCIYFRRAIAFMFDFDTILNDILVDSVKPIGPVPAGIAGAVATSAVDHELDIERARAYLALSQYADTFQDYAIEFLVIADVATAEVVALTFQAVAAELGMNIQIARAPWVSVVDRMGSLETSPHMVSIAAAPGFNDAGTYLETRYHSATTGTWTQGEWLLDPRVDAMIDAAIATVDEAERFALYAQIQHYIVDEFHPTVFLAELTERKAIRDDVVWPLWHDAAPGEIPTALFGFHQIFADMELNR